MGDVPPAKEQEGRLRAGGEEKALCSRDKYSPLSEAEWKNGAMGNYSRHCFQTSG